MGPWRASLEHGEISSLYGPGGRDCTRIVGGDRWNGRNPGSTPSSRSSKYPYLVGPVATQPSGDGRALAGHEINPLLCRPGGHRCCYHCLQRWRARDIGRIRAGQLGAGVVSPNPDQPAELPAQQDRNRQARREGAGLVAEPAADCRRLGQRPPPRPSPYRPRRRCERQGQHSAERLPHLHERGITWSC